MAQPTCIGATLGTLGNWRPELGFISLPFIFTGYDHVHRVIYGPVGEQVRGDVKASLGIEVLSFGASGFRVFLGNKPIRVADDCKGIKLRVPEAPVWIDMARALGANPTPIPADGVYTALQTHIVDAMEAPPDFMADNKLYEIAHDATRTNHIFTEADLMAGSKRMASLPADVQAALREAAKQADRGRDVGGEPENAGRRLADAGSRTPPRSAIRTCPVSRPRPNRCRIILRSNTRWRANISTVWPPPLDPDWRSAGSRRLVEVIVRSAVFFVLPVDLGASVLSLRAK